MSRLMQQSLRCQGASLMSFLLAGMMLVAQVFPAHTAQGTQPPPATPCEKHKLLHPDGTCHAGCEVSMYQQGRACRRCQDTCATCSGPGSQSCTSCPSSAIMFHGMCLACHKSCKTCRGPGPHHCDTCQQGMFKHPHGACKPRCDDGLYRDGTDCKPCDTSCATCSGAGPDRCMSCALGGRPAAGKCARLLKVALYNGLHNVHFEMIGHALEFCLSQRMDVDIYSNKDDAQGPGWAGAYERFYGYKAATWKHYTWFKDTGYDVVFLLTHFDKLDLDGITSRKVICIDHRAEPKLQREHRTIAAHVKVRYFPSLPDNDDWALPVFAAIKSVNEKQALVDAWRGTGSTREIHVAVIGMRTLRDMNYSALADMVTPVEGAKLMIHLVGRKYGRAAVPKDTVAALRSNSPGIEVINHEQASTDTMLDIVSHSAYMLFPVLEARDRSMSGATLLAFSFGCRIVHAPTWQATYQFKTARVLEARRPVSLDGVVYEDVFKERNSLVGRRDMLYRRAVAKIINHNTAPS